MKISEITPKTITHGEEDDRELTKDMVSMYNRRIDDLITVGSIGGIDIKTSKVTWPITFRTMLFFVDSEGVCGFMILQNNKRYFEKYPVEAYLVQLIYLLERVRGGGFGYSLYQFLFDQGLILQADDAQTQAAQNLWAKLEADPTVDVTDTDVMKYAKRM